MTNQAEMDLEIVPEWWKEARKVAFDTETTGVHPETAEVVEIALFRFDGPTEIGWSSRVKPKNPIPEGASKIHGIYDRDVVDAPPIETLRERVVDTLKPPALAVAYNGLHYDLPILQREIGAFEVTVIDPLVWVWKIDRYVSGKGRHKLTVAAARWGLKVDEMKAHGALYDARLALEVADLAVRKAATHRNPEISRPTRSLHQFLEAQKRFAAEREADFKAFMEKRGRG